MDLKLGRLEDMGDMSMKPLKNSLPLNMASSSSSSPVALSKRGRPRNSRAKNTVFCSVDGCASDLNQCREYHRRHKVCERHSKTPVVLVGGKKPQFCQQCSGCKKIIKRRKQCPKTPPVGSSTVTESGLGFVTSISIRAS